MSVASASFAGDSVAVTIKVVWVRSRHIDGAVDVRAVEVRRRGWNARGVPRRAVAAAPTTAAGALADLRGASSG